MGQAVKNNFNDGMKGEAKDTDDLNATISVLIPWAYNRSLSQ